MSESFREPERSCHVPVLLKEVIEFLALESGQTVVDGTVGGGGHSRAILEQLGPHGRLIGIDRDESMLRRASAILGNERCQLLHGSYSQIQQLLEDHGVGPVDRILLDLGLSSDQLVDVERGFGIQAGGPLDLRFDTSHGIPAWQFLQDVSQRELESVLRNFGEEPDSRSIAARLIERRSQHPIRSVADLVEAIQDTAGQRRSGRVHPATRVFQALRIVTNNELDHLESALQHGLYSQLKAGGRLVVITFHSLEDRLVKQSFRGSDRWQNLTQKPIRARPLETRQNPRARTAKLRAAIKN